MKRLLRIAGISFPIILAVAAVGIWHLAFRMPPVDLLPLPEGLIAADSPAGQRLLAESRFIADYDRLTENFVSQSRRAFCGVASSVVILNALRSPGLRYTQSTFFTDPVSEVRGALQVTFAGMTLGQLHDLLSAHELDATVFYASDTDIETFRLALRENLGQGGDFVLVNYHRSKVGQGDVGHISPVAAYHADTDRFLILDVAAYKYPPVWVSADELWEAMNTIDSASGRTRGFLVVREGGKGM